MQASLKLGLNLQDYGFRYYDVQLGKRAINQDNIPLLEEKIKLLEAKPETSNKKN